MEAIYRAQSMAEMLRLRRLCAICTVTLSCIRVFETFIASEVNVYERQLTREREMVLPQPNIFSSGFELQPPIICKMRL